MKTRILIQAFIITAAIFTATVKTYAQEVENQFETRTEVELSFKPLKNLKLTFIPELRFDENLALDKYLFEGEADYKLAKYLSVGTTYRLVVNPRDTKDTEYFNRFGFNITAKKEIGRFEPAFRVEYSNYADDEITDKEFLRYKASVKYDIKNFKLTPFVAAEAFQDLSGSQLYKMRYATGFDYKLFKNNYLGAAYKLDYYNNEYKNKHIFSVGYKIKF